MQGPETFGTKGGGVGERGRERERERETGRSCDQSFGSSLCSVLSSLRCRARSENAWLQQITLTGPSIGRASLTTCTNCYCLLNTFQITLIHNMSLHYLITLLEIFSKNPFDTIGFSNYCTVNMFENVRPRLVQHSDQAYASSYYQNSVPCFFSVKWS